MLGRTNTGGAGGTFLNFKVVGNPQPASPKENTIWVDADIINNYYFSATQPENMVEYDVWFPTGTSSTVEFNALKKNTIQVYPISAKQYVNGALVDVTAESYHGGKWVEWYRYLYHAGDECTDITGGWVTSPSNVHPTYKKDSASMSISVTGTWAAGYAHTKNKIDVTGRKTLVCKFDIVMAPGVLHFGLIKSFTHIDSPDMPARLTVPSGQTGEIRVDVSSITGAYYVGFLMSSAGTASSTAYINNITDIYLE